MISAIINVIIILLIFTLGIITGDYISRKLEEKEREKIRKDRENNIECYVCEQCGDLYFETSKPCDKCGGRNFRIIYRR